MKGKNVAGGGSGGGIQRLPYLGLPSGRRIPQGAEAAREPRLVHLAEEVYSAVELSIRHQEALWGIVILNSHEGPIPSDAIPPSLLPSLHAKMDASIEFSQLALVRLQELRALLAEALIRGPYTADLSFPPAPNPWVEEAEAGQFGQGRAFTAGGWTPGQRSTETASTSASGGTGPSDTVSPTMPKPVRPSTPLAPLKVPMRPAACQLQGTPAPSPELSRANTPAIYTAFKGNTDTRAMAAAPVSPRPGWALVPPSLIASLAAPPQETSHFPVLDSSLPGMLASYHNETGAGNIFDAGSRTVSSTMISSLPQPPSTAWFDTGPSTQAHQTPAVGSCVLSPLRPIGTRYSPRVSSSKKRANPVGERKYLQQGADPSKDIPSDGYSWRKYGQKSIRNSSHERCYYRCSGVDEELSTAEKKVHCKGKKQVQRSDEDPAMFIVYYRSEHTCAPRKGRGRGSSSASAGGPRQAGVARPSAQTPRHRHSHLTSILSHLPMMQLTGGLRQGMEAQPPLQQAQQLGVEFLSGTSETGTSHSSSASEFLFDSEFPILEPPWVEAMASLLLDDDVVDDAGS